MTKKDAATIGAMGFVCKNKFTQIRTFPILIAQKALILFKVNYFERKTSLDLSIEKTFKI